MTDFDIITLTFGQRLKLTRENARYSRKALGEITGIPNKSIEKFEYDTASPSVERLQLLSDALEVTAQYLMSGEEDNILPFTMPEETPANETSQVQDLLLGLEELDKCRVIGFKKYWRSAPRAFAIVEEALEQLELDELLDLAEKRDLFPVSENSQGLEGEELIEATELLKGFLKERILDTAYFGVDLYKLSLKQLHRTAQRNCDAVTGMFRRWKNHDVLVSHLREECRILAIEGKSPDFNNSDKFPEREGA